MPGIDSLKNMQKNGINIIPFVDFEILKLKILLTLHCLKLLLKIITNITENSFSILFLYLNIFIFQLCLKRYIAWLDRVDFSRRNSPKIGLN